MVITKKELGAALIVPQVFTQVVELLKGGEVIQESMTGGAVHLAVVGLTLIVFSLIEDVRRS